MFLLVVLCVVLLPPCILSSIENCTATKCLRCLLSVTPNCTVSLRDDSLLYNVYCEPPLSSPNCKEKNVTGLDDYCVLFLHKSNDNGQWTYRALNFQFQSKDNNCSNVNGNPILPHCLNLYSEVTTVEEIGENIICRCYEDDCQKRINITYRVTKNIVTSVSSSSLISPTTSSIIVNDDKTPSVTTSSVSANDDRTPSVTTSSVSANDDRTPSVTTSSMSANDDRTTSVTTSSMSANDDRTLSVTTSSSSDHSTLIPQSPQTPLSIVSIRTSIYGNDLPSNILRNNPNSLEGPLNIVMGVLAFAVFLTGILLVVVLFGYCYKQFSKRKQEAVLSTLEMTKFQANY